MESRQIVAGGAEAINDAENGEQIEAENCRIAYGAQQKSQWISEWPGEDGEEVKGPKEQQ